MYRISHIPTIAVDNTMYIWVFLQSLNFASGAQIQLTDFPDFFSMVLDNGKQMYFVGLEIRSSETNVTRAMDEAGERIRIVADSLSGPGFPSKLPIVLILDDKVTAMDFDVPYEISNIREILDGGFLKILKEGERDHASAVMAGCIHYAFREHLS